MYIYARAHTHTHTNTRPPTNACILENKNSCIGDSNPIRLSFNRIPPHTGSYMTWYSWHMVWVVICWMLSIYKVQNIPILGPCILCVCVFLHYLRNACLSLQWLYIGSINVYIEKFSHKIWIWGWIWILVFRIDFIEIQEHTHTHMAIIKHIKCFVSFSSWIQIKLN